jgi:stringent starvation protein B
MKNFKKNIIMEVFKHYEKVYMHVAPLPEVVIGERGFVEKEKEEGIILVFGKESYKDFEWDDDKVYVSMRFSGKWENLEIPIIAIQAIFNNPLKPDFIFNFRVFLPDENINEKKKKEKVKKEGNVISINFAKKE